MMCGESCGDGSILAVGEIRPSKDTFILLLSCGSVKRKKHKMPQKPRAWRPFMSLFSFLEDLMNNYSSRNLDIYIKAG